VTHNYAIRSCNHCNGNKRPPQSSLPIGDSSTLVTTLASEPTTTWTLTALGTDSGRSQALSDFGRQCIHKVHLISVGVPWPFRPGRRLRVSYRRPCYVAPDSTRILSAALILTALGYEQTQVVHKHCQTSVDYKMHLTTVGVPWLLFDIVGNYEGCTNRRLGYYAPESCPNRRKS